MRARAGACRCHTTTSFVMRSPFFFNDTATTEIYTLSLHDALPISFSRANARAVPLASSTSAPTSRTSAPSRRRCASFVSRSEEHTSELQSHSDLVCRLLLEKKKNIRHNVAPQTAHGHTPQEQRHDR